MSREAYGRRHSMLHRTSVVVLLLLVFSIIDSHPASAALCARWIDSGRTVSPGQVTVTFRTFAPISTGGDQYRLVRHAFDYPFRVAVTSPSGQTNKVRVSRMASDEGLWSGALDAREPGLWRLTIINLEGSDRKCYENGEFSVRAPSSDIGSQQDSGYAVQLAIVFVLATIVIGGVIVWSRARRSRE